MKAISLRAVSDDVYFKLQAWAKKNHRSMQEQVKCILEREVNLVTGGQVSLAQKWRKKLVNRNWGNIIEDVRKERKR